MSEYRRRRVIYEKDPFAMRGAGVDKVVMTHWVDANCYIVADSSSGQPQGLCYDLDKALDIVATNPGLVILVQPCIRSHSYEQTTEGFHRCPAVFIPKETAGSFWIHRCHLEERHDGSHLPHPSYGPGQWVIPPAADEKEKS